MWQRIRDLVEAPDRLAIGLMSGTSADGIDAALVRLRGSGEKTAVDTLEFRSFPYPANTRREVLDCCNGGSAADVCRLNVRLGRLYGECALGLAQLARVPMHEIAFIASHGQTIWHIPRGGAEIASTLQIGDGAEIAARTGCLAITDFRTADIAAGGEGAPLVPIFDRLVFQKAAPRCVVLNIGGIANITYLEAENPDALISFDTGPGNSLIDLVASAADPALAYDRGGELAKDGQVNEALLAELLAHDYFERNPPKSTGRELFGREMAAPLLKDADAARLRDLAATFTEFTARSIARQTARFCPGAPETVIAAGGGVHNPELMRRLKAALAEEITPAPRLETTAAYGVDPDAREAIAFAVMGNQTLHGLAGNVPAATGAGREAVLGKISLPPL